MPTAEQPAFIAAAHEARQRDGRGRNPARLHRRRRRRGGAGEKRTRAARTDHEILAHTM